MRERKCNFKFNKTSMLRSTVSTKILKSQDIYIFYKKMF